MPGLAEDPLYGIEPDPENGTASSSSIWDEIITEAGDVAVAVTQGLFGQTITPSEVTYTNAPTTETSTPPVTTSSWIWWVIAGVALLAIILLFVYKKKGKP